jgi:hypothetical protein
LLNQIGQTLDDYYKRLACKGGKAMLPEPFLAATCNAIMAILSDVMLKNIHRKGYIPEVQ